MAPIPVRPEEMSLFYADTPNLGASMLYLISFYIGKFLGRLFGSRRTRSDHKPRR